MSCAIKTLSSVGDINGRQVTSLIDDEFQLTGPLGWLSSLAQSQGKAGRNLSCEQINMGECKIIIIKLQIWVLKDFFSMKNQPTLIHSQQSTKAHHFLPLLQVTSFYVVGCQLQNGSGSNGRITLRLISYTVISTLSLCQSCKSLLWPP